MTWFKIYQSKLPFTFRHYYYEKEALVYGFYEENDWKFGLKDRGQNNGYSIKVSSLKALYVNTGIATYPLWEKNINCQFYSSKWLFYKSDFTSPWYIFIENITFLKDNNAYSNAR